jgi:hypothetical protein
MCRSRPPGLCLERIYSCQIGWLIGKTVCSQGSVMPVGGKMRLLWHDPELLWFKVGVSSNNSVSNISVRLVVQMLAPGMPQPYAN